MQCNVVVPVSVDCSAPPYDKLLISESYQVLPTARPGHIVSGLLGKSSGEEPEEQRDEN